ncbi:MAG TPA: hypothetical protein VHT92_11575 [Candidatus Cybelea sp.]|jgi:hypothetical protein|nr:hypothetical protein [Candidatus Cybelea sp.]
MSPSSRFPTIVLAAGAVVLLVAVALGERMGNRVIGQASEQSLQSVLPQAVTPAPNASPQAYGPDWKRSQALSAAGDPHFPDPRVPPQPLPTLAPTPKPKPTPKPTATPNPNVPIWRQSPLPTYAPSESPSAEESGVPGSPTPEPSPGESLAPPS